MFVSTAGILGSASRGVPLGSRPDLGPEQLRGGFVDPVAEVVVTLVWAECCWGSLGGWVFPGLP